MSHLFDNDFNIEKKEEKKNAYEKSMERKEDEGLITDKPDGKGGVQGIVLNNFFFKDKDEKIANEFYVVTDSEKGNFKKIEDASLTKIYNLLIVQ